MADENERRKALQKCQKNLKETNPSFLASHLDL